MPNRLHIIIALIAIALGACTQGKAESKGEPEAAPSEAGAPYRGGFTKEQRISDAQTIIGIMERGYAPREWKEEFLGLSFEEHSRKFIEDAAKDIDDVEFYALIGKYLSGFHDSHVSYSFPSTAVFSLPFLVDDIEGKIIVVAVDSDTESVRDVMEVGDELIEIEGKSAAAAREEILKFVGVGNERAEIRLATFFLTYRPQSIIPTIPAGSVTTVKIRSHRDGEERDVNIEWERSGREFAQFNDPGIDISVDTKSSHLDREYKTPNLLDKLRTHTDPIVEYLPHIVLEYKKPLFPIGRSFIERKEDLYYSGVFVEEGKKIGFLRIDTFDVSDISGALAEIEEEILYFENNADALIIDLTGNPGGNRCYRLLITSFFFDKPFGEELHSYRANRDILLTMEATSEDEDLSENDRGIAKNIAQGIRKSMRRGELLTDPFPLCALSGMINPYSTKDGQQITYTKPILILIDEFVSSTGEFFSAKMQDEGRAVLFGTPTMGAGGAVCDIESRIGYSEILLSYTISLGVRKNPVDPPNGVQTHYIENVGVIPDIEYQITLDDFMGGYEDYRNAVIQSALSLIDLENGEGI